MEVLVGKSSIYEDFNPESTQSENSQHESHCHSSILIIYTTSYTVGFDIFKFPLWVMNHGLLDLPSF